MTSTLPAGSRKCCGSRLAAAAQRPSGRSHSTRTDRSTIKSPTNRSRTQIRPGIHGADQHPNHHNHSPPPAAPLTQALVQIRDSEPAGDRGPLLLVASIAIVVRRRTGGGASGSKEQLGASSGVVTVLLNALRAPQRRARAGGGEVVGDQRPHVA